jgi:hypothetical protein
MPASEGDLGVPTTEEWSATERAERSDGAYRIEDLRGGFERYPLCRHGDEAICTYVRVNVIRQVTGCTEEVWCMCVWCLCFISCFIIATRNHGMVDLPNPRP